MTSFDVSGYHGVLRFIARRIANQADAEDIAQNVYLRVIELAPEFVRNPRAYIFKVARNAIHDYFKGRTTGVRIIYNTDQAELAAENPSHPQPSSIQAEEEGIDLSKGLKTLRKPIRQVIELACQESLSVAEIACQTGLAESTVVKYRTRGKRDLQDYLKDL